MAAPRQDRGARRSKSALAALAAGLWLLELLTEREGVLRHAGCLARAQQGSCCLLAPKRACAILKVRYVIVQAKGALHK